MNTTTDSADTIVAVGSASGVGALAIVRISGSDAHAFVRALSAAKLPPTRQAALRQLRAPTGNILDRAIVIRYDAPRSYTGEDAVEIICHGGWVTSTRIVQALVEAGARPALPGEFTRRAVLNGRLDILQAEAVNDLIRAESTAGATMALRQLDGGLSQRIADLRESFLGIEALLAYEIDFPEEDDGPIEESRITDAVGLLLTSIDGLIATAPMGELVRHGAMVAIVGPPNVGKSSLFNALLGRKRALVTDVPGTTRDALEAVIDAAPVPLRLVDTAGLRDTTDGVEKLGVALSHEYLQQAQAVLVCGDTDQTLAETLAYTRGRATGEVIPVRTKSDLAPSNFPGALAVSVVTGSGLDGLTAHVSESVAHKAGLPAPESPVVTHARYRQVLQRARDELMAFRESRDTNRVPAIVAAVHLREGVRVLEELIGSVDVEDVLARVFRDFCVGK